MAREMKDSGVEWIGEIPANWSVKKVKHGFYRSKEEAHQEEPVVLTLARDGVKIRDMSKNEGQIAESYYNYNFVLPGDLLINPMDLYSGANCSVSKVSGVISPAYIDLRHKKGYIPNFYDYYFKTQYWAMAMFAHGKGVSFDNRWTLGVQELKDYFIPVPCEEEQKNIAMFLDSKCFELDNILSKTRASIEEYKKLKLAFITRAVTKGIRDDRETRDSGIEWIGEIPKEWDVKKLRYLGRCQNGISKSSEYFGVGYPFVSYGDVYRNYQLPEIVKGLVMSTDSDRENYSVIRGDVFFTRTSETIEEVGFSSVCLKTIEHATFAGFVIRFRSNSDELLPEYSKYYFRSDMHRRFFVKEMNLVTRASLGQELLKQLPVILPPLREQQEIANYLEKQCGEIDGIIAKKNQYITELESYKKSLIYEYVTGKKEVSQEYQM